MNKTEILEAQKAHLGLWKGQLNRCRDKIQMRPPGPRRKELRRVLTHLRRRRAMLLHALHQAAQDSQWKERFALIERAIAKFRTRALRLDFTLQEG